VCFQEGFCQRTEMPKITTVITEAMPQARDGPKGRKLILKRAETREGCQAHIVLRSTGDGKFEVIKFHDGHVDLLCAPIKWQFLTLNRNFSSVHKDIIGKYARANILPSKVYHLMKEQVVYENISCI